MIRILAAALVTIGLPLGAQTLVPSKSEVNFTTRQMGVPVAGRFSKFSAELAFDPKKPDAGKVTIWIDTASATFGATETEAEAARPNWFDSARFPQATFHSSAVKPLGGGRYDVVGKLEIKGQAREIVVPVALAQRGDAAVATGQFTIKRLDFKLGEGMWSDTSAVANDVLVKFRFTLAGMPPA